MQKWTESYLLTRLNEVNQNDAWMFPEITSLSKLIVTLNLFNIREPKLSIEEIGPTVWCYACNYYMGRFK